MAWPGSGQWPSISIAGLGWREANNPFLSLVCVLPNEAWHAFGVDVEDTKTGNDVEGKTNNYFKGKVEGKVAKKVINNEVDENSLCCPTISYSLKTK